MRKYIFFLLAISLTIACSNKSNKQQEAIKNTTDADFDTVGNVVELTPAQAKIAGVEVGQPKSREIAARIRVNGVLEAPPQNILSVTFPLGGYIKSTRLLPGMQIKKGSVLASIEDAQLIQLQQDYLMGKAKLVFAAEDFKRQATLNKSKANSDKVFQEARAEYESQKILVKALSEKLKLVGINPLNLNEDNITRTIYLHSPINAYVSRVNINPGKYVTPTDVLFELVDPSGTHLSLTVFEKDVSSLRVGQKVTCYTSDQPEKTIPATIELITPNINQDRSVEVHCKFDHSAGDIRPGTFVNAEIHSDSGKFTAVPDDAIVRWNNRFYVFVEKSPNTYQLESTEPGTSSDGYTAISNDLKQSKIVVKNAYTLLMKLKNISDEE